MKKLNGKVAFVTGGSRGMGAAIVKRLSEEGAHIVFTHSGKNAQQADEVLEAIQVQGSRASSLVANNENPQDLLHVLDTAMEKYGSIDILVNNAGIYLHKAIEECTLEEFDRMMDVNVKAVFVASQFVSRSMKRGGRIITIGSNMADRLVAPGGSLYSMSKSALIGLTKGMARDLGPRDITVNLIQPGPVDTDMNPAGSALASKLIEHMPSSRYGKTSEIAGLVAYLAGEESQFITGTSITIDGGFNI